MKKAKSTDCSCGREEILPNRFARDRITGGDPYNRMANNYSKKAKAPQMGVMTGFATLMGR